MLKLVKGCHKRTGLTKTVLVISCTNSVGDSKLSALLKFLNWGVNPSRCLLLRICPDNQLKI